MAIVGVPKEVKPLEKRVGLTPSVVSKLTQRGIKVLIQKHAGEESGFEDADYQKSGATIVTDAAAVYAQADMIQKVKEPQPSEFDLLRPGQIFFCYLHLASPEQCHLVRALQQSKVTAIGFETVETGGRLPLLAPMSEIAGGLASAYASLIAERVTVENDRLKIPNDFLSDLSRTANDYPDFGGCASPGKVVIWGGGVAGQKAMRVAMNLRGQVTVIEKNPERQRMLEVQGARVITPEKVSDAILEEADVFIGCVHMRGERAAKMMSDADLEKTSLKRKKIIVDVSIDQGGNFPQAHSTTYADPLYLDSFGNIRFSVANMPSLCGRAASELLSDAAFPYTQALGESPVQAFKKYPELAAAINVQEGKIKLSHIEDAHRAG